MKSSKMAGEIIRLLEMDSNSDSEEKYGIYKPGSDMVCVFGVDNKKKRGPPKKSKQRPRYKQLYREVWETMRDFQGWLASVPGNTAKAYCKLCQKELHCHRLSLLKHKVTYKHQKKEEEHNLIKIKVEKKKKRMEQSQTEDSNMSNDSNSMDMEDDNTDDDSVAPSSNKPLSNKNGQKEKVVFDKIEKISTHVLDTSRGEPGTDIHVVLYKLIQGRWTFLLEGNTDAAGRFTFDGKGQTFTSGRYKIHYDVDRYYQEHDSESIFPFIEIIIDAKYSPNYHIPVLLNPYGYTTYKGQ